MTTPTLQSTSRQIALDGGPSVDRMVDAFKYAYDRDHPMNVVFTDDLGQEIRVQVQQLAHEDGSGQSVMFAGAVIRTEISMPFDVSFASGYWNGHSRKGFIHLSDRHIPLGGPGK